MDRPEDFEEILMSFCKTLKVCLSFDAIQQLKKYSWPGNIRELKNIVTRISAYYPDCRITGEQIQSILEENDCTSNEFSPTNGEKGLPPLKEIERQMIIQGLINHAGNQRRVSSSLGMPKSTLHDRLRYYNINPRDYQKLM
jgi:DNA-binding NtrC family response regulator